MYLGVVNIGADLGMKDECAHHRKEDLYMVDLGLLFLNCLQKKDDDGIADPRTFLDPVKNFSGQLEFLPHHS